MEHWEKYLFTAETALETLTHEQVCTVSKMLALELGAYRQRYGDEELEKGEQFIAIDDFSPGTKDIFVKGMEALLAVVRHVDTDAGQKH